MLHARRRAALSSHARGDQQLGVLPLAPFAGATGAPRQGLAAHAVDGAVGVGVAELRSQTWMQQDFPVHIEWWVLAIGFAASEIFVIHYQFRRERYTFSLMELPLALGLFFSTWPALVGARIIGGGLALLLHRKQSPMKLAFNLASFVLETSVVVTAFGLLAGSADGQSPRAFLSAMTSVTFGVLLVTATIALVISINEGPPDRKTMVRLVTANFVVAVTNVSLALVAVSVLWVSQSAGWLLLVVACILFLGYRSYARLQQKHDDLELLYDFTRQTGRSLQLDSAMRELLNQTRNVLRAGIAEITIRSPRSGIPLVRTVLDVADELEIVATEEDDLWRRMVSQPDAVFAPSPVKEDDLAAELASHGARDALIAPLRRADGALIGYLPRGNRLGDHRTFQLEDLKLFEALANHASVSLENRHLIERLRSEAADKEHQALHDALTGLPNRLLFHQRVEQALSLSAGVDQKVGVMLLDLDRFKEVNDTLGHHNGDLLLQEIGDRLRRTIRAGDTVARLGGDEFAVLLPELSGRTSCDCRRERHPPRARATVLGRGGTLDVGASIGIAMWPDHGDDAVTLLQRADVAMYAAKATQDGVDVYDPNRDTLQPRAARARRRAAPRHRAGRARRALPAEGRHPHRAHHRHGGARALGAPGARAGCRRRSSSRSPSRPVSSGRSRCSSSPRRCASAARGDGRASRTTSRSTCRCGTSSTPSCRTTCCACSTTSGSRARRSRSRSPSRRSWPTRCAPRPSSAGCGRWAWRWRSTTSAPATRRSATCGACRSTRSRSTAASCSTWRATTATPRSCARSSTSAATSASGSSPRASKTSTRGPSSPRSAAT